MTRICQLLDKVIPFLLSLSVIIGIFWIFMILTMPSDEAQEIHRLNEGKIRGMEKRNNIIFNQTEKGKQNESLEGVRKEKGEEEEEKEEEEEEENVFEDKGIEWIKVDFLNYSKPADYH